jgi:hypothetical protein
MFDMALEPTRDQRATLPDLIEVLLNRGVILDLDLIIAVADIPLIGVSLKAAIAGLETMLAYGMMRQWDEQTRAWLEHSLTRDVPLARDEEVLVRMSGAVEADGLYTTWRPSTIYLTSRRIFAFRREPRALLWEAPLEHLRAVELEAERSIGGEQRLRIRVTLAKGTSVRLSASAPDHLAHMLQQQIAGSGRHAAVRRPLPGGAVLLCEGPMWYEEPRAGGRIWREGYARLDRRDGFVWDSSSDVRPAVVLAPAEIGVPQLQDERSPVGERILVLRPDDDEIRLAADDLEPWIDAFAMLITPPASSAGPTCPDGAS